MKNMLLVVSILALFSCKKQDEWLNVKSNKADVTPQTLADYQALLDNDDVMNNNYPGLGLLASDNFYLTYDFWQSLQPTERNAYLWKPEIYQGDPSFDWEYEYKRIEYSNIVLDGIGVIKITDADKANYDNIKGSALFYRAFSFYNLLQLFAAPYDVSTANAPGIVIRLHSDVNEKSVRTTIDQCYLQVINDLLAAEELLPSSVTSKLRPSKSAALALLARVSLTMKSYDKAAGYATAALGLQNKLMDFNTLDPSLSNMIPVFPPGNEEIIFFATAIPYYTLSRANMKVDTLLYQSYDHHDLRYVVFYKNNGASGISYRGNYTGKTLSSKFAGLATNELFLIRAESYARLNKTDEALADLNALLQNRWAIGFYIPPSNGMTADSILNLVLQERRKELPFTGSLRWEDLRRLNQESAYAKNLIRILNGESFSLPAGDKRYVYAIPDNEIRTSHIQQNAR
jgi:starch-binding outer membrane protein, SusD/RagB family